MQNRLSLLALLVMSVLSWPAMADEPPAVLADGSARFSYDELQYRIGTWPEQMQHSGAIDTGDRLELLNRMLTARKLAAKADELEPGNETYWRYRSMLENAKRNFMLEEFNSKLTVPDMSALAKERYETEKEKYARVPERRMSSHILFSCPPGQCSRDETREQAQKVLEELRADANFEEMVKAHSDDPASNSTGGKFDRWLALGEPQVEPYYVGGVFEIEKVGAYSELVSTKFGIHIIRLDAVEPEHFKPFEDVREQIVKELESEYRQLALKEYVAQFDITDKAYIDGKAMDKLFAPYR